MKVQAIQNNWGEKDLKPAMDSLLFERTVLSTNKEITLKKSVAENDLRPADIFRNTYLLEFLGLEERISFSESDVEKSIIKHLQHFLIEIVEGFCFEARKKE